ncbi:MAG: UDP-N-acetylmuramate dehydrogenase [Gammaproteobacteria bacterium]
MTALRGEWRKNYPLSRLSSWRVGGPAEELFLPADLEDMSAFYRQDKRAAKSFFLGYGSNLLVRDGGIPGVVVRTAPGLSALRREEDGRIYAEAGAACAKLARFGAAAGFSDAAFLAGVPGTVGGALAMNAGCEGAEIWDYVDEAVTLDKTGARRRPAKDFAPGYRSLKPKRGKGAPVFAAAYLRFAPGDAAKARARVRELLRNRAAAQPLASANCGSVFCNPPGGHAAKLIEACGLKGARIGGAEVSRKHANFIINRGGATAADIENLLLRVQKEVRQKTKIALAAEVRIVGKAASEIGKSAPKKPASKKAAR